MATRIRWLVVLTVGFPALAMQEAWSASGTEGASFLDIPVGAAPTGMGSAYTAMATDAYAPVWNPAGLAHLDVPQMTGTHLDYLESMHYEFISAAFPLGEKHQGIGASLQYLGSGNIDGRDNTGNPSGNFSTMFAAYSLAYGHQWGDQFSWGITGKAITESIADASASAFAADFGGLYRPNSEWTFGTTLTNLGSALKLVNQADPLPMAYHLGTVYDPNASWRLALEGVYRRTGLASAQMGVEWKYGNVLSVRTGYNTSHLQGLSGGAGFTAGLSLFLFGQEFAYAWSPYGDLGNANYLSLTFRFGTTALPNRPSTTHDENITRPDQPAQKHAKSTESEDYDSIYDVLTDTEKNSLHKFNGDASK